MKTAKYRGQTYVVETDNGEKWSLPLLGWQYPLDDFGCAFIPFGKWQCWVSPQIARLYQGDDIRGSWCLGSPSEWELFESDLQSRLQFANPWKLTREERRTLLSKVATFANLTDSNSEQGDDEDACIAAENDICNYAERLIASRLGAP